MSRIICSAASAEVPSEAKTCTLPSSITSIFTPVASMMERIFLPPGPMRSRILSVGMVSMNRRGAYCDMAPRETLRVWSITSRMARRAVADLPATRTAQEFHFAHGKRRKVIVQHEALEGIVLEQQIQALPVLFGAQGQRGQGLGFPAGKEGRAVYARQQADFAGDLANLVEGAAVGAPAGGQNVGAGG